MQFVESSHSVYSLSYPIAGATKYRRRILNPGGADYVKSIFPKLLRSIPGGGIEGIGFDKDRVHFVMIIPPKYSISDGGAQLKSQSAAMMKKHYKWLSKDYDKKNVVWPMGYFVCSVGANEKVIKNYAKY